MIYDCFTFFNELDLLEIRLNVLKDVVDRFVLVESNRTFTNRPKPLYYQDSKERFAEFADRIIHIVVDDCPQFDTPWHYESHQRNAIARGLVSAKPDDTIIVSDVDEIPDPISIGKYSGSRGMIAFQQTYYAYYLNYHNVRQVRWTSAKMVSYDTFLHGFDGVRVIENEMLPMELNIGTTASKIRMRCLPKEKGGCKVIKGGWHFTSLGGAAQLAEKMRSFSHQEYNRSEACSSEKRLAEIIAKGEGPFWAMNCFAVPLDERFPKYIRENKEKYAHLIFNLTPEYLRRVRVSRILHTIQGYFKAFAEWICPAALHNFMHLVKMRIING